MKLGQPRQIDCRVDSLSDADDSDYLLMRLHAPDVAGSALPGQFVALAVGGDPTATLLRRCFSLHRAEDEHIEIVFDVHGPGTEWLAGRRPGDLVDVVGPLGVPFPAADPGSAAVLVGGGYGSAPLVWLAESLSRSGIVVHAVHGAATSSRLFGVAQSRSWCDSVTVTTEDGTAGTSGRVTDVLPALVNGGPVEVYACGPMPMLRAVHEIAAGARAASHSAVEEAMACGIGVCMTCVLPVVGDDGVTRMTRSCVAGPVFDGYRVRWDAVGTVPPDALGAPTGGGH